MRHRAQPAHTRPGVNFGVPSTTAASSVSDSPASDSANELARRERADGAHAPSGISPEELATTLDVLARMADVDQTHPDFITLRRATAAMFKAAILSDKRYDLELADGSWVDSRVAARMALAGLNSDRAFAKR